MNKSNSLILILSSFSLFFLSCNEARINIYQNKSKKVCLRIISDKLVQDSIGEYLSEKLIKKLYEYSSRSKTYEYTHQCSDNCTQLQFYIHSCTLFDQDTQKIQIAKIDTIFQKYRNYFDSTHEDYKPNYKPPMRPGLVGTNIAANVIANLIAMPLGYYCVIWVSDAGQAYSYLNKKEKKLVNSTCLHASIEYTVKLITRNKNEQWSMKNRQEIILTYPREERFQLKRLIKNSLKYLEEKNFEKRINNVASYH